MFPVWPELEKEPRLKTTRSRKHTKDETILVSLAESIGSTLGSLAAKANATQKALSKPNVTSSAKRMVRGLKHKTKLSGGGRRRASGRRAPRRRGRK
jgi:hypothetical protein